MTVRLSTITEIAAINEAACPPGTIAFVDIDETVIGHATVDFHGLMRSPVYKTIVRNRFFFEEAGVDHSRSARQSLPFTPRPIEHTTVATIQNLAGRVDHLFYLTTRESGFHWLTYESLKRHGLLPENCFDLKKTAFHLDEETTFTYRQQTIYSRFCSKGRAAHHFLRSQGIPFTKILFIDNMIENVESFQGAFPKTTDLDLYHYTRLEDHNNRQRFPKECHHIQAVMLMRHDLAMDDVTTRLFMNRLHEQNRIEEINDIGRVKPLVDEFYPNQYFRVTPIERPMYYRAYVNLLKIIRVIAFILFYNAHAPNPVNASNQDTKKIA